MSLPIFNTNVTELSMMQTKWASQLNPLLSNVLNKAYIIKNIKLQTGDNTINHLQDKALNGYIITRMQGSFAQIYEVPSDMPKKTLILNASAPTTVDLMVF